MEVIKYVVKIKLVWIFIDFVWILDCNFKSVSCKVFGFFKKFFSFGEYFDFCVLGFLLVGGLYKIVFVKVIEIF